MTFIYKCTNCGHSVKYVRYFQNNPYGIDCWFEVAKEFIEKRDNILNQLTFNNQKEKLKELDKLAKEYGV